VGYKDEVKRELVGWNETTQRIFFDVVRTCPQDLKNALMFEMTTQRFAEIATHKDENLIRSTFVSIVELMKSRKKLLGELSRKVGMSENHSELDLLWVLRYGMEFFPEYARKEYNDEREKVFSRMVSAGTRNRINAIIGNIEEQNGDNQSET
tara:strand:- start:245 stop:700 length:456 start_codon:yes stop_codon:yes gene_type:complete